MRPAIGPPAVAIGSAGDVRIPGGPRVGRLTSWRLVVSPTTGRYTLLAEARMARHYAGCAPLLEVRACPDSTPARIGRPTPRPPRAFVLRGVAAELTPRSLILADGEIRPA